MTSSEIRQSFLDFFRGKGHTIVPSAPLMPDSPNLLFTNAGMNQFVPFFLGDREAPYHRAADTQKCVRAGGKHNDLEDVGFDTYHHTFFEMLGNWSFGDYFKTEAINFAWELLTDVWGFPKERLYATVYRPGEGDPAEFDREAFEHWRGIFERVGMDPDIHIRYGDKADNFWMMGETGPCGPCSEIHMDLTPAGDTGGRLVNADSPWCIELWNLVFIQFNADADGSFTDLPARHVDTGMGFERVAGIFASTNGLTDFSKPPSNYDSDLFTELFSHLSGKCGHSYQHTMPEDPGDMSATERNDCALRVLADHARTLCFAVADNILPGNEGRNYVLRRILRRAVMFGKRLELPDGFFAELVPVVVRKMGEAFPELRKQESVIRKVIASEEAAFDKTIERGLQLFEKFGADGRVSGEQAFMLYDTYGFPLDLTQLLARERGIEVDLGGFREHMEAQRERARAAQKKEAVEVRGQPRTEPTEFVGYALENASGWQAEVRECLDGADGHKLVALDATPFYPEMGGQVGDTGSMVTGDRTLPILDTRAKEGVIYHEIASDAPVGGKVKVYLDLERRRRIQRHHSATHIVNWALRTVLGGHIRQAGSLVAPDRLRFDFAHFEAVSDEQFRQIESMVNEAVLENAPVHWYETAFDQKPDDVIAVFGEKYGDTVRVVDIGGFSKELCGGTHVRATGEIGLVKLVSESGIAAGTRRLEAVCGEAALEAFREASNRLSRIGGKLQSSPSEIENKIDQLQGQRKELEKEAKRLRQKAAAGEADALAESAVELPDGTRCVVATVDASETGELRNMAAGVLRKLDGGLVILGAEFGPKISVVANVSPEAAERGHAAGAIIRDLAGKLGGKGGGKADFAMGGAENKGQLSETLRHYRP